MGAGETRQESMRVLVADDEPRILDLFTEILAPTDDILGGLDGLGGVGPAGDQTF